MINLNLYKYINANIKQDLDIQRRRSLNIGLYRLITYNLLKELELRNDESSRRNQINSFRFEIKFVVNCMNMY